MENFINKYSLKISEKTRYIDLVSEIGELGKEIIKSTDYGNKDFEKTPEQVLEVGDCIFSLLALCYEMDIDAQNALQKVIAKYESRFTQKNNIGSGK